MTESVPQVPTAEAAPSRTGARFIDKLGALDRGERAVFRRNAGRTIAESHNAVGLFYSMLPQEVAGQRDEEIYFLVATLSALNDALHRGDFGSTLRAVRSVTGSESIDRRMAVLLDSEFDLVDGFRPGGGELAHRLRQCVKLAAGHRVGVDWPRLLDDLVRWSHPGKRVRKQWARSYFGSSESEEKEPGKAKGGE